MAAKRQQDVLPVYVVAGKDAFLVSQQCERLLDRLLPVEQRAMALYQPRSDEVQLSEVFDELRTLPLLAARRVVLLREADDFISQHREALEKYLDAPSPTGVLVLAVASWPKTTRLAKKLPTVGELMDVGEIAPWELPKYAARVAREQFGKEMSSATADLLIEFAPEGPGPVAAEIEKLAVYVGDRPVISSEDVEALVGHNRVVNAFAVLDEAIQGRGVQAIERLRNMLASDRSAEYSAIGAFAWYVRQMFAARAMLDKGMPRQAIEPRLKVGRRIRDAYFARLTTMSLSSIAAILVQLARIDHGVKTGRMTLEAAIEQVVLRLAATPTKRAAVMKNG